MIKLKTAAKQIQSNLLETIHKTKGMVIPSGWVGHAIALILKFNPDNATYDLTIVNTGRASNIILALQIQIKFILHLPKFG